jgi:hypothetical protein
VGDAWFDRPAAMSRSTSSSRAVSGSARPGGAAGRMLLARPGGEQLGDGLDPALIDANYAAVAANVPTWCADFEAAGALFRDRPGTGRSG